MRKKLFWWERPADICPICGKKYSKSPGWYWKIGAYDFYDVRTIPVCSYTCMRTWEKEQETKQKKKTGKDL